MTAQIISLADYHDRKTVKPAPRNRAAPSDWRWTRRRDRELEALLARWAAADAASQYKSRSAALLAS